MPEIEEELTWDDLETTQEQIGDELEPEFAEAYDEQAARVLRVYLLDQLMPYVDHNGEIGIRDQDKTHPYDMCDYAGMDIVTFEAVRMEYTDRVKEVAQELADENLELETAEGSS